MTTDSPWRRFGQYLPPDREIIVRTGDRVGYLRLPRWLQLGFAAAAGLGIVWIALATHLNYNQFDLIARRDARIAAVEDARHDIERTLVDTQRELALVNRRLEAGREHYDSLADENRRLTATVGTLRKSVEQAGVAQAAAEARHDALQDEIAGLQRQVAAIDSDGEQAQDRSETLRRQLAQGDAERQRLTARIAALLPTIEALEDGRAQDADRLASLRVELAERVAERDAIADARDRLTAERELIADRFASLSDELETLETAQQQIISRFDSQTVDSIELVEKTLALTGLDVDRLLGRLTPDTLEADAAGVGGPFVAALDEAGGSMTAELASNIAAVEGRVARWQGLQTLLARLPLTVPLDSYRITSTFGRRVDPLANRPAMHEGIDFSGEHRAEVRATSPGRISFVGWRGGYGKMVEVDHGLGIRTRYAHLAKMYVKPGQQVDFRDKLGQVGNTGRSTGEHLHYEVLLDGRALDPANFLKAGQYVFKN